MTYSANIGFLYTELALPDRIRAAKAAGFGAVECHFPYDTPAAEVAAALEQWGRIYEQASDGVRAQMSASVTQALLRGLRPRAKQRTGS